MKNIKLTISYDGTKYLGWQRLTGEKRKKSIQGIVEDALKQIFGQEILLIGSGRTDAGVHARGQVANFHVPSAFLRLIEKRYTEGSLEEKLRRACNEVLPEDICVLQVQLVSKEFHSRYSALAKTYEYIIDCREVPQVFWRKRALWIGQKLDLEQMKKAVPFLIGEKDFRAFSTKDPGGKKKNTVRTVYSIELEEQNHLLYIRVRGNGFLYNMVRIIVGTLIGVGTGQKSLSEVQCAIETGERKYAGYTASSVGLYLKNVEYGNSSGSPCTHCCERMYEIVN